MAADVVDAGRSGDPLDEVAASDPPSGGETIREMGYALPAGLVTALHLVVALAALGAVISGIGRQGYAMVAMYSMLTSVATLITAVAGTVLCVHFWSRRSWWFLVVPAVTLPAFVAAGLTYLYFNWSY